MVAGKKQHPAAFIQTLDPHAERPAQRLRGVEAVEHVAGQQQKGRLHVEAQLHQLVEHLQTVIGLDFGQVQVGGVNEGQESLPAGLTRPIQSSSSSRIVFGSPTAQRACQRPRASSRPTSARHSVAPIGRA